MGALAPFPVQDRGDHVLIPEGEYEMVYVRHDGFYVFRRFVCAVTFRIITFGEHFETSLLRYYKCRQSADRSVNAPAMSDLFREYCTVVGRRPDRRRIALSHFANVPVIGRVRTVTRDRDQDELPAAARYSKVAKILRQVHR